MTSLYLDFEYRNPQEENLEILCCAWELEGVKPQVIWLEDDWAREEFTRNMHQLIQEVPFVAYSVEAEARCLFQLFDEFDLEYKSLLADGTIRFVDLMLEYRMLLNHNHEIAYGKQLINGKVVKSFPPLRKWEPRKANYGTTHRPEYNLAAACFKMLEIEIDTEEKNQVRDLIISNKTLTPQDIDRVQYYCLTDIQHLPQLHKKISNYLLNRIGAKKTEVDKIRSEVYARGEYAALTAIMTRLGYPYDHKGLKHFASQVKTILHAQIVEMSHLFPDIKAFQWNKKAEDYIKKEKPIREWLQDNVDVSKWPLTDKGNKLSLSTEAFMEFFDKTDTSFGGYMRNYLKLKQDLNGFIPAKPGQERKTFWDSAGSDSRARPYYGIYGSQSARSQPSSTGFIPLKASWFRYFIKPKPGRAIVSIDYSSQEFLVAALVAEDEEMIRAYESGDPYVYFAQLDGAIPPDGNKITHPEERETYKTTALSIQYGMEAPSLSLRLSKTLGKDYPVEDSQDLINSFNHNFEDYHGFKQMIVEDYEAQGKYAYLKLPCGWYMFGDNKNPKSVGNFPFQGFGSSIMRKAVALATYRGLDVIMTLHDALYVEFPSQAIDYTVELLQECMHEAFQFYFPKHLKERAKCRTDVFIWSPDYKNYTHGKYKTSSFYLDKKSEEGYKKFSRFLLSN